MLRSFRLDFGVYQYRSVPPLVAPEARWKTFLVHPSGQPPSRGSSGEPSQTSLAVGRFEFVLALVAVVFAFAAVVLAFGAVVLALVAVLVGALAAALGLAVFFSVAFFGVDPCLGFSFFSADFVAGLDVSGLLVAAAAVVSASSRWRFGRRAVAGACSGGGCDFSGVFTPRRNGIRSNVLAAGRLGGSFNPEPGTVFAAGRLAGLGGN